MKSNGDPAGDAAIWVRLIRAMKGWRQEQLAEAARMHRTLISAYETGDKIPRPSTLARLAAAAGTTLEAVKEAAEILRRRARGAASPTATSLGATLAASIGERTRKRAEGALARTAVGLRPSVGARTVEEERAEAEVLWLRLAGRATQRRRRLIELSPAFLRASLVERLAHESERAAVRDVDEALALAELALLVAERVGGPSAREYAHVFIANARRVEGEHDAAESALGEAKRCGSASREECSFPFSRARMFDVEASLRRDQRRFEEALELQTRAFEMAEPEELGFLWLSRAALLQESNDPAGALVALQKACAACDERSEPRDRLVAQFNLVASLLELGRNEDASQLLPDVRALAEERGDDLDLLRVRWLEGKSAAATGRADEAVAALDQVRREFAAKGIGYDSALAALELATFLLDLGRTAETRTLVEDALPIFQALKIGREALATVSLFIEAAKKEAATAELARQALGELKQRRG